MKRLIKILLIISSSLSFAQNLNENIIDLITSTLKIDKEEINLNFVVSKPIPYMENTEMYIVPIIIEEGEGYQVLNNSIFFIENNKTLKYYLRENYKLYTDAIRLNNFEIDFAQYNIQQNNRAFGVKINYSGSSSVNPSGLTTLNLYQIKNNQIINILNEFIIYRGVGENNGWDSGEYTNYETILIVDKSSTDNYRDFIVKEKKIFYEFSEYEEKETKTKYKIKAKLKFDKKLNKYVINSRK